MLNDIVEPSPVKFQTGSETVKSGIIEIVSDNPETVVSIVVISSVLDDIERSCAFCC